MTARRTAEQATKRSQLAAAIECVANHGALPDDMRRTLLPTLCDLHAALGPGGSVDDALRRLGRTPRRQAQPRASGSLVELPGAGALTLTPAEIDALVDCAEVAEPLHERQGGRRLVLAVSIDFLQAGVTLPDRLRAWVADALSVLHEALEAGARPDSALEQLGKAPKGRPAKARPEVEIAAAVAALERYVGKSRAVTAVTSGLVEVSEPELSESEVWRICERTDLGPAWASLGGNRYGISMHDEQASPVPSEEQAHQLAVAIAGVDLLLEVAAGLLEAGLDDLWPRELGELLPVTKTR